MTTVAEAREALAYRLIDAHVRNGHGITECIILLIRALIAESRTPEPVAEEPAVGEASDEELRRIERAAYDSQAGIAEQRLPAARRALYNAGRAARDKMRTTCPDCGNVGEIISLHCSWCNASKKSPLSEPAGAKCSECGGTGEAMPREPLYPADVRLPAMCPSCHGTGRSPELTPVDEAATKR